MKNIGLILISVALVMAFRPDLFHFVLLDENEQTINVHDPAPTRSLQDVVAPIRGARLSLEDSQRLSSFYRALADVIDRDENGIIKTSAEVRLINERSGRLCFEKTGIAGRYLHLAEDIDVAIGFGIGSKRIDGKWESVEVTSGNRMELVNAIRAIAWACQR